MMAPITAAFYVLKAIVLTPYVIESSADFQAKGARASLNHHCTPRCSKAWSAFKGEITDATGHKTLLVAAEYTEFLSLSIERYLFPLQSVVQKGSIAKGKCS